MRDRAHARLSVPVNLSARQLLDPQLVDDVAQALTDFDLDPPLLTSEITETVAMQDTEATTARLGALIALGVRLAIDDFGPATPASATCSASRLTSSKSTARLSRASRR